MYRLYLKNTIVDIRGILPNCYSPDERIIGDIEYDDRWLLEV